MARRKVFVSYHRADKDEVRDFIGKFDDKEDIFIHRSVGAMDDDIINSDSPEYIMRRIRESYLVDSTVTLVMIGRCTWARKFVDWEIQSSLRQGPLTTPNGLLGVILPSAGRQPTAPERLRINIGNENVRGYARWYWMPDSARTLAAWIEDAFQARTGRAHLITNPRDRFTYNKECA